MEDIEVNAENSSPTDRRILNLIIFSLHNLEEKIFQSFRREATMNNTDIRQSYVDYSDILHIYKKERRQQLDQVRQLLSEIEIKVYSLEAKDQAHQQSLNYESLGFKAQLNILSDEFNNVKNSVNYLSEKVNNIENRVNFLSKKINNVDEKVSNVENKVDILSEKVNNAENVVFTLQNDVRIGFANINRVQEDLVRRIPLIN